MVSEVLTEILTNHPGEPMRTDARILFILETFGYPPTECSDAAAAMALGYTILVGAASDLADMEELDSMQVAAIEKLSHEFMCACARLATAVPA